VSVWFSPFTCNASLQLFLFHLLPAHLIGMHALPTLHLSLSDPAVCLL
jgi:hypothetical protein